MDIFFLVREWMVDTPLDIITIIIKGLSYLTIGGNTGLRELDKLCKTPNAPL